MIDGAANHVEMDLLRSAERDGVSKESRRAILGALGVAVPLPLIDGSASSGLEQVAAPAATSGASASAALGTAGKGLLGLLGAGIVGVASVWSFEHFTERPIEARAVDRIEVPSEPVLPKLVEAVPAEAPLVSEAVPAEDPVPASEDAASKRVAARGDSLSREVALIRSAKSALAGNDAASALRRVEEYEKQFPKGSLRAEANMLRIEALVAAGQRDRAARLGKAMLDAAPNGPYARRIRSLLGELDAVDDGQP